MLFNSLEFLLFFFIVTTISSLLSHSFRWFHLLIAKCIFYKSFVTDYMHFLAGTILIDYFVTILLENLSEKQYFYNVNHLKSASAGMYAQAASNNSKKCLVP